MAGKGTTFAGDVLKLVFQAVAIANIADNTASTPATGMLFGLHTADPGPAGTQGTTEISYTGYLKVTKTRNATNFPLTAGPPAKIEMDVNLDFPASTGGTGGSVTHASIGPAPPGTTAAGGTNKILYSGVVSPAITVANGVTPRLTGGVGNTNITEV